MYAMKGRNVRKGAKKEVRDIKNLTANRKLAIKMRQSTKYYQYNEGTVSIL